MNAQGLMASVCEWLSQVQSAGGNYYSIFSIRWEKNQQLEEQTLHHLPACVGERGASFHASVHLRHDKGNMQRTGAMVKDAFVTSVFW